MMYRYDDELAFIKETRPLIYCRNVERFRSGYTRAGYTALDDKYPVTKAALIYQEEQYVLSDSRRSST